MTTSSNAETDSAGGRDRFWRPAGPDADCPRCGGVGYVRRSVPVGHELFGRALPCECAEQQAADELAERLQRLSNLGPLAGQRLAAEQIGALDQFADACAFADEQTAERWLVLRGAPSPARTQLAAELANRRLERSRPALYFVAADLLDRLRAAYRRDAEVPYPLLFEHARQAEFLIIDDIDVANPTEWAREKLFQLLNHRRNAQLRTVLIAAERASADGLGLARWLNPAPDALQIRLGETIETEQRDDRYRQVGGMRRDLLARFTFEGFRVRNGDDLPSDASNLGLIKCVVEEWAAAPSGSLALFGRPGTGKTHLAAAVANAALERGESVWFAVVPDLLDTLRRTYQTGAEQTYDELSESLRDVDLLILDDFGAHSPTLWTEEKLYQLYAARYVAERPTLFTTNLEQAELDHRITSRWHSGKYHKIEAPDYRSGETSTPEVSRRRGRRQ